jgi:hypothetical protein
MGIEWSRRWRAWKGKRIFPSAHPICIVSIPQVACFGEKNLANTKSLSKLPVTSVEGFSSYFFYISFQAISFPRPFPKSRHIPPPAASIPQSFRPMLLPSSSGAASPCINSLLREAGQKNTPDWRGCLILARRIQHIPSSNIPPSFRSVISLGTAVPFIQTIDLREVTTARLLHVFLPTGCQDAERQW